MRQDEDFPETVSHARSIIEKIEDRRARKEPVLKRVTTPIRYVARRYAMSGGKAAATTLDAKLEAAFLAGATWTFEDGSEEQEAEAQLLVEEIYGSGKMEDWQLQNVRNGLRALADHRKALKR